MKYLVIAAVCLGTAMARPDGAGGHHGHHGGHHSAPAAAPATGYEQPATGYEQPSSGYEQPSTGYEQPAYDQSGYDQSGYSYPSATGGYAAAEADSGIDMNMILIPILIIAGLALLFPSVTSVAVDASRKKRSAADEAASGVNSVAERVQDIYMAVLESEECMERVACEVGGLAADAGLSPKMLSMASPFVPKKYSKMMKTFSAAKDCHKIKCGKLF